MNDATAMFEARTKRLALIMRFLSWDCSPSDEADDEIKSAHNLAVEASYHAVRQAASELCISCKPSLLKDLSKDSEIAVSQAAPDGHVPDE